MENRLVKANCTRSDCFACFDGKCEILSDNCSGACKFFKTREQYERDLEKAAKMCAVRERRNTRRLKSLLNAADEAMIDFEHKRERKAIFSERLTTTIKLPPEGEFRECSNEEYKELRRSIGNVSEKEIYRRLQAYEDTGLSPEEITALVADNKRLHALVNAVEVVLKGK